MRSRHRQVVEPVRMGLKIAAGTLTVSLQALPFSKQGPYRILPAQSLFTIAHLLYTQCEALASPFVVCTNLDSARP